MVEKLWKIYKLRDIKIVKTERRRNYLVSEPNYTNHTKNFFTESLLAIEMKKLRRL